MTVTNPRVFISYSHDSDAHMNLVFDLSERLREEGVDCEIDQYETSPTGGWARWTRNQLKEADFVLVVCTKNYEQRYEATERKGVGAGAKWEGAIITQQLYEAEGGPHKFIPVVFSTEDTRYIPIELRGGTFYILDDDKGYQDLYRHVTGQPKAVKRQLGKLRSLPPRERKQDFSGSAPTASSKHSTPAKKTDKRAATVKGSKPSARRRSSLVLILTPDDQTLFVESLRVEAGDTISMTLLPANNREATVLDALNRPYRKDRIAVAFGSKAIFAQVVSIKHVVESGRETWSLELKPEQDSNRNYAMYSEFSLNGQSPDEIAELRARRILLDEKLFGSTGVYRGMINSLNQGLLESSVKGRGEGLQIPESPFPKLYAAMKSETAIFIEAARLYAVLLLTLTNTVASIHTLDLRLQGKAKLAVRFEGQRPLRYVNQEPHTIKVNGTCDLIGGS
jgi:hypothetical protein